MEDIPRGARLCDKTRVRRHLGLKSGQKLGKDCAFTDKEFAAHVVRLGLREVREAMAWAQTRASKQTGVGESERLVAIGMEAFLYKHRNDVASRLAFAWQMNDAPHALAASRATAWDDVVAAASTRQCTCQEQWIPLTEQLLQTHCANFPDGVPANERPVSAELRSAIAHALKVGCQKHVNIFLYGPNTSGKSHLLKPLIELFKPTGQIFLRPVGHGNFPIQDIFGKKACVLQDVRVNSFKLSFDSLLVWWEGESFMVPLPRNQFKDDREYAEAAPVFISSGSKFTISAKEADQLQVDVYEQNGMMDARFRFFHFPCTLTREQKKVIPPCARCFAKWVLASEAPPPAAAVQQQSVELAPVRRAAASTDTAQPATSLAFDAVQDWMETHGGEVRLTGSTCNLHALADAVSWSSRFLPDCGRLVPFLRRYGVTPESPDVVIGLGQP